MDVFLFDAVSVVDEDMEADEADDLFGVHLEGVRVVAGGGGDGDGCIGVGYPFEGGALSVDLVDFDGLGVGGGEVYTFEGRVLPDGVDGAGVPACDPEFLEFLLGLVDVDLVADDVPFEGVALPHLGDFEVEVTGGDLFGFGVQLVSAGDEACGAEGEGSRSDEVVDRVFHGGILIYWINVYHLGVFGFISSFLV